MTQKQVEAIIWLIIAAVVFAAIWIFGLFQVATVINFMALGLAYHKSGLAYKSASISRAQYWALHMIGHLLFALLLIGLHK